MHDLALLPTQISFSVMRSETKPTSVSQVKRTARMLVLMSGCCRNMFMEWVYLASFCFMASHTSCESAHSRQGRGFNEVAPYTPLWKWFCGMTNTLCHKLGWKRLCRTLPSENDSVERQTPFVTSWVQTGCAVHSPLKRILWNDKHPLSQAGLKKALLCTPLKMILQNDKHPLSQAGLKKALLCTTLKMILRNNKHPSSQTGLMESSNPSSADCVDSYKIPTNFSKFHGRKYHFPQSCQAFKNWKRHLPVCLFFMT